MRTIRVTGKGNLKDYLEMIRITIELTGRYMNYDETLRHSSEGSEHLREILLEFGFERSDLKTLYCNCNMVN